MAWNLPRDGGGFNAGFDTGGPERVWQAGQTGELADLANKPQYADFYNNLLNEYGATKEDVVTGGTWMNPEGTVVDETPTKSQQGQAILEEEDKPWWKFWNRGGIASLENRPGYKWGGESVGVAGGPIPDRTGTGGWLSRILGRNLDKWQDMDPGMGRRPSEFDIDPGIGVKPSEFDIDPGMGVKPRFSGMDFGLGLLEDEEKNPDWITKKDFYDNLEEENQWIQRRAEGGIASTRPGYVWGGLSALGKTRSQRAEDSINRLSDYLGPSRSDLTTGKFSGGVDRPSWGDYANTYSKYGDDRFTNVIKHNKLDTLRSLVNAGPLTNIIGRGVDLYKDWKGRDEDNPWGYQEGGAVGLEPGIGSLMGYAKGGMVTRVKVPKGQSKWMKKFMNNMRDK